MIEEIIAPTEVIIFGEKITTVFLVDFSLMLIVLSLIIIIVSLFIISRKTAEEESASEILKKLKDIKQGKTTTSKVGLTIQPHETSLKDRLKKKFQSKIESQLKTKIEITDFNAKGDDFLALVNVSGVKILLTLDSSGKIIDYKKIKAN